MVASTTPDESSLRPHASTSDSGRIHSSLTHPLGRLRGMIRMFVAVDVVLFLGLFVTVGFWFGVAADFGLFKVIGFDLAQAEPRGWLRGSMLGLFIILMAGLALWRIWALLTKDFHYTSLALLLEKRHPELLGDRLITAVELADVKAAAKLGYSAEMIEDTIRQARERVGQVSLSGIFNYRRLVNKALVLALLMLLGLGSAFAIHAVARRNAQPVQFAWQFTDVASIWGERNLLLMKTPWPRRAYVEILEFPDTPEVLAARGLENSTEKRVEKGTRPVIKARVYKWVVADRQNFHGWRPMRYSDLNASMLGFPPPECPQPNNPTIDELEITVSQQPMLADVFAKLSNIATDPWYSRKVRRLDTTALTAESASEDGSTPTSPVQLQYRGISTRKPGSIALTRAANGEYSGELCEVVNNNIVPLTDSVEFTVAFEDFQTAGLTITLVPQPALSSLERTEYQPAYLHHAVPLDGSVADLTGKLQKIAPKRLSLTGDRTLLSIPTGTDLEFTAAADKPLVSAKFIDKLAGKILYERKGSEAEPFDTFNVRLGASFTSGRAKTEFSIVLTDTDGISSTRILEISTGEDRAPEVEVVPDIIRKVNNQYWITPRAHVPFNVDSLIRDDVGLREIRYNFQYWEQKSEFVNNANAAVLAGLANDFGSPIRTWGLPISVAVNDSVAATYLKLTAPKRPTAVMPVSGFQNSYSRRTAFSRNELAAKLKEPLTEGDTGAIKMYAFKTLGADTFDLETPGMPKFSPAEPSDIPPRYRIDLFIEATDVNAEFSSVGESGVREYGKKTRSLTPIPFLVVPEEDLITEISKDEEKLGTSAAEALKRAEDARNKLLPELSQLARLDANPAQLESSSIRLIDVMQDVGRAKELCLSIQTDAKRVIDELDFNRCNDAIRNKWRKSYMEEIQSVLEKEVPNAEKALAGYQTQLANKQRPSFSDGQTATDAVEALIRALAKVRNNFGVEEDLSKRIQQLTKLLKRQEEIQAELKKAEEDLRDSLRQPNIALNRQYAVKAGQKTTLTLPVVWGFYIPPKGELTIRVDVPEGTPINAPATVIAKDDREDYKLELTVGDKPGIYPITLTPLVGKPAILRVEVQK